MKKKNIVEVEKFTVKIHPYSYERRSPSISQKSKSPRIHRKTQSGSAKGLHDTTALEFSHAFVLLLFLFAELCENTQIEQEILLKCWL